MDLFKDIISSINQKDRYIMDDSAAEKAYVPFVVNKAFSYDDETVLYSNEMNRNHHISNKMQYDFYFFGIPKKKRFNKWLKTTDDDTVKLIQEYYNCNLKQAKEYLNILEPLQIKEIKTRLGYEQ